MIDLTPLDVRNKRGDFKKNLRGYDPQEVDVFLELVAERLEALVRENMRLQERSQALDRQVSSQSGRERAVQEALVTAQELRSDIRAQAQREAELILDEARAAARHTAADAERKVQALTDSIAELEKRRLRFLKAFRQLLERELDVVEVEEEHAPLEEHPLEIELGGGKSRPETDEPRESEKPRASLAGPGELVPNLVDASGEVRPPLDISIEELNAAYKASERVLENAELVGEDERKSARELVLPLQDDSDAAEDDAAPG